jgi:hypothetical protein
MKLIILNILRNNLLYFSNIFKFYYLKCFSKSELG